MKRLAIALCLASAALAFGDRNLRINEASAPANGALLKFDSTNWRGITTTASDIDALLVSGQSFGNLTLADGSITDASGAISFGDENLSTTGTFTVGDALTVGTLLMADATSATIATGTLTVTQSAHTVLGEGAASDDLDTIAGLTATDTWLVLRPGDAAQDITIKHGTGNIVTSDGADYDIPDNGFVLMIYDGSNWRLLSAGGGGASAAADVTFSPTGTIAGTNVQTALAEVASEAVPVSSATPTYCVAFTIPDEPDDDAQHYQIEIDDTADFSS
ncbi:MAG: hypothetical protein KKB31_07275, partial [Nanoarchaeota archaeon]|nr:hypothetical protein [Nanoarchaeota archaeon]